MTNTISWKISISLQLCYCLLYHTHPNMVPSLWKRAAEPRGPRRETLSAATYTIRNKCHSSTKQPYSTVLCTDSHVIFNFPPLKMYPPPLSSFARSLLVFLPLHPVFLCVHPSIDLCRGVSCVDWLIGLCLPCYLSEGWVFRLVAAPHLPVAKERTSLLVGDLWWVQRNIGQNWICSL